jgi:integrase
MPAAKMQPGIWSTAVRREVKRATRYPGVWIVGENEYRIRGKKKCLKTGKTREVDRVLSPTTTPPANSAAEAARVRGELLDETEESAERMRLGDFATSWLDELSKGIELSTTDRYATALELHIVPALGEHYLDKITHQDIVDWRDAQTDAPSSVNGRLRVLKQLMKSAAAQRLIPWNPAADVSALPEEKVTLDDDDDGRLLTGDELAIFLETARAMVTADKLSPLWFALLATLAYTAMRIGEATALRWTDLDEQAGLIRIRRAQWRGHIKLTKSKRRRSVPFMPPLTDILREYRAWLVATQHLGVGSGWLFPAASIRKARSDELWPPCGTGSLRKPLIAVLEAIELEGRITTHGLRRTWNNLLRQVAAGEVVRATTGHVTEAMTEHYSHVHQNEKAQAATRALSLVRSTPMKVGTLVGTPAIIES